MQGADVSVAHFRSTSAAGQNTALGRLWLTPAAPVLRMIWMASLKSFAEGAKAKLAARGLGATAAAIRKRRVDRVWREPPHVAG
jgi:hypothetical protein